MSEEQEQSNSDKMNKRFYSQTNNKEGTETKTTNTIDIKNAKSLKDFNYYYNDKGQLRSIDKEEKFQFVDQDHYDRMGDFIVREIQDKMMNDPYQLDEVWIPKKEDDNDNEPIAQSNIFLSKDFYENTDRLMIIICGSGAVRAGQWARSLCINNELDTGSILPYLDKAQKLGFSLIVLNPNFTSSVPTSNDKQENGLKKKKRNERELIKGSETPFNHVLYCWDNFIKHSPAKEIAIVAHSFGGEVTRHLLDKRTEELRQKIKVIAFTDSVHGGGRGGDSSFSSSFFKKNAINWVTSREPLNTDLGFSNSQSCQRRSAGHNVHEFTSGFCINPLFEYVKLKLKLQDKEHSSI
ncbi:hypothetical protein CYY_009010 [Polysphondylium violaceum]|uniref:Arb2 domain-containing protein n=1 Tax=Polysphondylium violaceum TaxID=133409 RepID=A0A8J4UWK6_9MYCE|nr:hypothetical protein CYY_009010 [Polysphondylium violaceum]